MKHLILLWIAIGFAVSYSSWHPCLPSYVDASARRSGLIPSTGRATMADVERLARAGERIYAIRCYREIHRCSLADAKKAVDALCPPSA